jgi:mediator of RNA polymerase II transcription subunit 12, fungi type
VNTGFTCIANILEGVKTPLTSQGVQEILDVASEQLRLLAHVVELARDDQTALPVVDSVAQDSFIMALANKIKAFETVLAQPTLKPDVPPDQATQGAILMARLLQFNMAFRGVWTAKARSLSEDLCTSTFKLALVSTENILRRRLSLTMIRLMAQGTILILLLSHSFLILTCTLSMVGYC